MHNLVFLRQKSTCQISGLLVFNKYLTLKACISYFEMFKITKLRN
jgi:hypothetical protein